MMVERLRIRDAALEDTALSSRIRGLLARRVGVLEVRANTLTGSLLVIFDPGKTNEAALRGYLEKEAGLAIGKRLARGRHVGATADAARRRFASVAVLASTVVTVGSLFFKSKTLHAASGAVMAGLGLLHILRTGRRAKSRKRIKGK